MSVFEKLSTNKGTVSSALGKALAQKVLQEGQTDILTECMDLVTYEITDAAAKNIRAGAAKVVQIVAEKQPEMVAPYLKKLLPALSVPEPQTRWMLMRVMGYCAHLNKSAAQKAVAYAQKYVSAKEGLIIASSADLFLGDYGALSEQDAREIFPILARSLETAVTNEQDWLLEALYKVYPYLAESEQQIVLKFAENWLDSGRKSTQKRAKKLFDLR